MPVLGAAIFAQNLHMIEQAPGHFPPATRHRQRAVPSALADCARLGADVTADRIKHRVRRVDGTVVVYDGRPETSAPASWLHQDYPRSGRGRFGPIAFPLSGIVAMFGVNARAMRQESALPGFSRQQRAAGLSALDSPSPTWIIPTG